MREKHTTNAAVLAELRGRMEHWEAGRREALPGSLGKSPLSEVIVPLADALCRTLSGELEPGAPRIPSEIYSREEVTRELAVLRDAVLTDLRRPEDDPLREPIWRFFDAEIFAVLAARAGDPEARAAAAATPRTPKDTETLPGDGHNPIADAYHSDPGPQYRRRIARDRALLLAEVSKALSRSIRFEDTLDQIASIAVRALADWTIIDAIDASGRVQRRVLHRNPARAAVAAELEADYVPRDASRGVPSHVLRTRESLLIPRVTDEHYRTTARSPRHEQLLRALGSASYMAVPMVVRDGLLGAITLVSSDPEHLYGIDDVTFAEEFASRAALVLENSILYQRSLEALRMRDDFLSMVSHDLKSPLQVVDISTQMLERGARGAPEGERSLRLIESIRGASQRMRRLINDLLDLSRLEAGRLELSCLPEPVDAMLHDLAAQFEPLAASKSQRLEVLATGRDDVQIFCERERVFQALANLLSNAVKFTPRGGMVTLGAFDEGAQVCLEVRDTGPGIPGEHVPHLFERFWQAQDQSRNGTGLGLSIAHAMVQAHHGSIEVDSAEGRGTRFRVRLPKPPVQEPATRTPQGAPA